MRWTWRSRLAVARDFGAVVFRSLFWTVFLSIGIPIGYFAFANSWERLAPLWDPAFDGGVLDVLGSAFVPTLFAFMVLGGFVLLLGGLWSSTREEMSDVHRDFVARNEMAERAASQAGDLSMSVASEGGDLTQSAEAGSVTMGAESRLGLDEAEVHLGLDAEHAREVPS